MADGVGLAVAFVFSMLFFTALSSALLSFASGAPQVLGTAGGSAATLILVYVVLRDRTPPDRSVLSALCVHYRSPPRIVLRAIPPLVVGMAVYFAVGWGQATILRKAGVSPESIPRQQAVKIMMESTSPAVQASVVAFALLLAPVVEETVFRGVLYLPVRARLGPGAAGLLVSVVFAGIHNYAWGFPHLLIVGLTLAAVFEATGTLLAPIAAHSLYNLAMVAVLWTQGQAG